MHRLLAESSIAGFSALLGAATVKSAIDDVLREARAFSTSGEEDVPAYEVILARLQSRLSREASRADLREVLNGTGILLHTNLGRAPLAQEAIDAMAEVSRGYCNLEYDLETGTRGSRYDKVVPLLRSLAGAEDALVVNNCAAAMLLILDTFARGREVIVARNQLIEIGGGFRLPDVLERSGARLVEVGTTNKVYLSDYERALSPNTGLILRTHASNFRVEGFVADVAPAELVALGRRVGVPVVEDLGSGSLIDLAKFGLPHERTVQEAVVAGTDLVAFSGDKLLGGPQAGVIVGSSALIAKVRANPLLRALRVDKSTLAALSATLQLYREGTEQRIPFYEMLTTSERSLRGRAEAIVTSLQSATFVTRIVETVAATGGGALPLVDVKSVGVMCSKSDGFPNAAQTLRAGSPPLATRSEAAAIVVDLRTIPARLDSQVLEALSSLA